MFRMRADRSMPSARRILFKSATRLLVAVVLCAQLVAPASAAAKVLDTDLVSEVSVANRALTIADVPDVSGDSAVLFDGDGRILWARDIEKPHAMASITKLMTAAVALENSSPDAVFTVSPEAARVGQSTSGLRAGDTLDLANIIAGLLVSSGNDAAFAVAENIAGGEEAFVEMMNDKATELGMTDTHFANPHGLDADGHLTTVRDLAVLVRYAMGFELIRSTVALPSVTLDYGNRTALLDSTNDLLTTYEGANGVKTGFTDAAGHCLAAGAVRGGIQLYAVVLGSPAAQSRFTDCATLFDWGFAHYVPLTLATADDVLAEVPVKDYLDVVVGATVAETVAVPVFDFDGPLVQTIVLNEVRAPVKAGDRVGTVSWTQAGRSVATAKLVATEAVEKPSVFERVSISVVRLWRSVFGGDTVADKRILATVPVVPDPLATEGVTQ